MRTPLLMSNNGANGASSVYAADVDGDGDMDVLSASFNDDKIAWYENDGRQNFTNHIITRAADGAQSVYAADVDGDGDLDVLSASSNDDKIAWYENDGEQNFTSHVITSSAAQARSVYAADVDGDGDMDVLSASRFGDNIAWYENDGQQNFTSHTITTDADGANLSMPPMWMGTGIWMCSQHQGTKSPGTKMTTRRISPARRTFTSHSITLPPSMLQN
jgi:hypothetical protein